MSMGGLMQSYRFSAHFLIIPHHDGRTDVEPTKHLVGSDKLR